MSKKRFELSPGVYFGKYKKPLTCSKCGKVFSPELLHSYCVCGFFFNTKINKNYTVVE